jgi:hypothetical protein
VTLRDGAGAVLADLILGEPLKDKPGLRYVRVPGQKRTYAVKTEADASARFEDWVEANILRLNLADLRQITVLNYTMNESAPRAGALERSALVRSGESWKSPEGATPKQAGLQALLGALSGLKALGARPKPPALAEQLRGGQGLQMTLDAVMSLRQRGFFITPDGRLLSAEGELQLESVNGVVYSLRFGEIVTGQTEGAAAVKDPSKAAAENRFLFVTATFDPQRAAKFGGSPEVGQAAASAASARYADWYYIISGADVARLRPARLTLLP